MKLENAIRKIRNAREGVWNVRKFQKYYKKRRKDVRKVLKI